MLFFYGFRDNFLASLFFFFLSEPSGFFLSIAEVSVWASKTADYFFNEEAEEDSSIFDL